jgi:hypothetical protein
MHKDYLGDSVYAEMDDVMPEMITLTTENGYGPSNTIHLEPEVVTALHGYIGRACAIARELRKQQQEQPPTESSPAGEDQ